MKLAKTIAAVLLLIFSAGWRQGKQAAPIDPVIIFAGQSQFIVPNTTCGQISTTYSYLVPAITNVKISDMSGTLTSYQACVNSNPALGGGIASNWGTEAQFAYRWSQDNPTKTLYIIKNAIGSTPLYNTGNATSCTYLGTNVNWSPESTNNCFAATTALVATVISNLQAAGKNPKIVAIMWNQGGTDAEDVTKANAYAVNLADFISKAQTQWAGYAAPVFVARLSSQSSGVLAFEATVRAAQNGVASLNSPVINTDTFGLQGDNLHPSAAGNIQLGDAFYNDFVSPVPGP